MTIGHDVGNGVDDDVGKYVSELLWGVMCDNNIFNVSFKITHFQTCTINGYTKV
jgi:hypothetical protein